MSEVHVTGLKDLQALLDTLPAKLEANVMRGALRAGLKPIKQEAQARVAVASGELRDGLKISARIRYGKVTASLKARGKHGHLAHWIEFGTAAHRIMPKNRKALIIGGQLLNSADHPGTTARPFMRPAMDSRADDAVAAAGEYIKKRLATKEGLDTADINIEVGE
jgi:HK97 gp10 family phage protein